MNIHTAKFFNLSDIAPLIGEDVEGLRERLSDTFTWGDTDASLVRLPLFLAQLEESEEETIMESLQDIIGTSPADAFEYFVNLTA
jgi:hypothetical protein